ncbi:hypothetical protein [Bradyrhizobium australiense]|uniref:Uncharacterized protein n=1 Tax=Bradyrhizobium australiense TaxID=2721161 RepID=A0A7Y4LZE8_9BRAD|nr:hypothetical protein [Bradyrhizobium australiense]NOJ44582.1 hypothetical protein [Bradyrhizobium australiense]
MAGQNVRLTAPVVGEKPIRSVGVAQSWHISGMLSPNAARDLRCQFAELLVQALVGNETDGALAIKPCVGFFVDWHRPLRISAKESRSIPAMQWFVRSLSPLG